MSLMSYRIAPFRMNFLETLIIKEILEMFKKMQIIKINEIDTETETEED